MLISFTFFIVKKNNNSNPLSFISSVAGMQSDIDFQNGNNKIKDWRWQLANQITDIGSLNIFCRLQSAEFVDLKTVTAKFPFALTPYLFSIIDWSNESDPILRQVLPDNRELDNVSPEAKPDPLNEVNLMPVKRLIHRYPDRAVLIVTNRCSAFCRHCNRKRSWKDINNDITNLELEEIINYLKDTPEIREVILSGGDPLILQDDKLKKLLNAVFAVGTIKVVRIGTRVPVFLPMRITEDLCRLLEEFPSVWINTQFNHPLEITKESKEACEKLQKAGIPLSNQAVLLKGINDSPEVMIELCRKLQEIKVRPYYLFQCDLIEGTEHFWTPLAAGKQIIERMTGHTGGLCVPRFVIDLPGGKGKIPIIPDYIVNETEGKIIFKNYKGEKVEYIRCLTN